jgi:DNA-binding SARP family transcriptional activator
MDAKANKRSGQDAPGPAGAPSRASPPTGTVPPLLVELLGGFRVERIGVAQPVLWQRRSARTLTKLLATHPRHSLHREEILELLWPGVQGGSALNRFGQALHAARRAFEPELLPRESSAYLRLMDSMLALDTEHVVIDADHFQILAESVLGKGEVSDYESALAAYGGELLPEDRYQDWCAERRAFLGELHTRLMLELADALKERGDYSGSADRLRAVLQDDPTREDVHRRLITLYAEMGTRNHAVRQFQSCRDVLRRELGLVPEEATLALYQDVLAERIPIRSVPGERGPIAIESDQIGGGDQPPSNSFIGRESVLRRLREQLKRADQGDGHLILVSGEPGVGKTRLAWELAVEAHRGGASILWGGSGAHANLLAYGPFAVALEGYVSELPDAERGEMAHRYPALVPLVPSLGLEAEPSQLAEPPGEDSLYLVHDIIRFLADLARQRTVVLVLGELHNLHSYSLDLLQYLAHLAVQRRWLIIGTFLEEGFHPDSELRRLIEETSAEDLCLHVPLQDLERKECDQLVRAMLEGGEVDEALLEQICDLSLGNPLFVESLVRDMKDRGELVLSGNSWRATSPSLTRVPGRVRTRVAMRVSSMPESVRRVLELAAIGSEMEVSLRHLRAGAAALQPPLSDADLFDALDSALEARILEERMGVYSFRHPLVRSALCEDMSKHRRDQLRSALDRSTG